MYAECEECATWETSDRASVKVIATQLGCGGAAQAAPLFATLATVASHFLN